MALKLTAPIEKEFVLTRSDEVFGIEPGEDPTRITVKQATQAQHERRQGMWDELIQEVVGEMSDPDYVRLVQRINLAELNRLEVFLTLTGCNILGEDDKELFKFGKKGLAMTEAEFKRAWGQLPPLVAAEIHEKVREVNSTWGPRGEVD